MAEAGGDGLDYRTLFTALPAPCIVLDRDLVIVAVNDAYLEVTGRPATDLLGRNFFEANPPDPGDPASDGAEVQRGSLEAVLFSGRKSMLLMQRYALPRRDRTGRFEPRWWNVINQPVTGPDGRVELIMHRVEDVTEFVRTERRVADGSTDEAPRAEIFSRAEELQRANLSLQESALRTKDVALALQRAMLATPALSEHPEVAVCYRPALEGMNACGDWYDVVDLPDGRLALSVGDVVGHGVEAASVMGMLRSALSAAIRVADGPSGALEALGLYARAQEGAMATTTFACQIYPFSRLLMYSNAGHPPPVLMHADGSHELLDQATDPPLGVRVEHVPRPQATVDYREGDTLVMYTDGLIERRGEDIDVGLNRLVRAVRELRELPPDELAEGLLRAMADPSGQRDDISLLATRL
ncbi:PAS domain S-box-containing protein [Actinacidiphila yanglinensis]|uniref:PAS domain S-box-containing protein n=1 Tax=Actinacidiphila yanglinensis TaxID=310779 RepID=A0A1H6E7Z0_9ACTN|nr:SpoIIE family protein phosphatase [Actinacidiphila yanglinensis]SEG93259.1 PAS domain S-box-containing protein [Actinacidiphila yanglinensis]